MEMVKHEHVEIFMFVSYFLHPLDKYASNMEDIVHSSQLTGEEVAKELQELLNFIQIKFAFLSCVD